MNDSELEAQLRALSPVRPSADLERRIARQLTEAAPLVTRTAGPIARPTRPLQAFRWLRDLGWAGAGAGVALAGLALFSNARIPAANPAVAPVVTMPATAAAGSTTADHVQAFEPAESSRELVSVKNADELLETEDGPVRQVRYTYVERMAWAHPTTGARLEIEVPREDVYLMPVSLQ